eukprot:gene44916-59953_t
MSTVGKKRSKVADDEDDDDDVDLQEETSTVKTVKSISITQVESTIDLGGSKKVSVSTFKGKKYINIREYYTDKASNEEKPGKKGIALTVEQWQALKSK